MKHSVIVPSPGESIKSGILAAWLKSSGQRVEAGDELFEFETDKATLTVSAQQGGVLLTKVEAGKEIQVGDSVAEIDTEGVASVASAKAAPAPAAAPAAKPVPAKPAAPSPAPKAAAAPGPVLSPAARKLANELSIGAEALKGAGGGGRLTKPEVAAIADAVKAGPAESATEAEAAARRGEDDAEATGRVRRERMSPLRKRIAENLVRSRQAAAHLTTFNEIDMSRVMDLRKMYGEAFEKKHGVKLGLMSFFVKASVLALKEFPAVNSMIDGDDIVYFNYFDIGIAVSTDRGLVVPVLRGADVKIYAEIERDIVDFSVRARDKRLTLDEMSGGTFTITNGGVFGSLLSTPIPVPPQTAILGIHTIKKRPVVVDDQIVIRPMTYAALTYDHRVIDGREAVSFLVKVKQCVEDPQNLLLGL